jgi:hypothetical protein
MPPAIGRVKMAWTRRDLRRERFQNRPIVQWATRHGQALELKAGGRLVTALAAFRDGSFAAAERIDLTVRRIVRPVTDRVGAGFATALGWLDSHDPARELVARLRLAGAMRTARAALADRDIARAAEVEETADGQVQR